MNSNTTSVNLKIAGITMQVSSDEAIKLNLPPRLYAFLSEESTPENQAELHIHYTRKYPNPGLSPTHIWQAGLGEYYWKTFHYGSWIVVYLYDPDHHFPTISSINLKSVGEISITTSEHSPEILRYPLDIILLQILGQSFKLLLFHGSGFSMGHHGWVALGQSGSGKTTIANLAKRYGAYLIQDDRLFLRLIKNQWVMFPVPLQIDDRPSHAPVSRICILRHGTNNQACRVRGSELSDLVLPHMVHFPGVPDNYLFQMSLANQLIRSKPVYKLQFLPDETIVQYLSELQTDQSDQTIPAK